MRIKSSTTGEAYQARTLPTICHVIPSLEMGGMERVAGSLMASFEGRGHRICLFCTDREGELFGSAHAAAKLCGRRRRCLLKVDWRVVSKLRRFVRDNDVQILHAHNLMAHMYSVLAAIGSRVSVVVTVHGLAYFGTKRIHRLQKLLSLRTARVICVSDSILRVAVGRRCFRQWQLAVIRNGIQMERFVRRSISSTSAARQRLGVPAGAFVVGSVGRFAEVKNYPMMVRAFARFVKKEEAETGTSMWSVKCQADAEWPRLPTLRRFDALRFMLILVGDGPERANIERAISECGITGSVLLPGMQEDIVPWLDTMDVFCLSSRTEGTSLSMLEAGAVGLPAVATRVGGNGEVIDDGVTGQLVPEGDEDALACALKKLSGDREMNGRMGSAAAVRIRDRYSLEGMADQYAMLYADVAQQGRRSWT